MATADCGTELLRDLNDRQREAVQHGEGPLLVVAGAGTGKTRTLVHRVAHQIHQGTHPGRILLVTFTRRAAAEMLRRVGGLLPRLGAASASQRRIWGGTFHAIAARLLRLHGQAIGLDPAFTILDRSDAEDLLDVIRTELNLARSDQRFPRKGTCLSVYSNCVNSQRPIEEVLAADFPWCQGFAAQLKQLFQQYVDRKARSALLDYDDLLLFWRGLLDDTQAGDQMRGRFDAVLVDEYQDTNRLQAEILERLRPDGRGLTVVGDDAQSIYSFRAATIRNILEFPDRFPGTTVIKLEENYRSCQPILAASNQVIAEASERYAKTLWSTRQGGAKPALMLCEDEDEQSDFVATRVLEQREAGLLLREQAVLFRASHHSMALEAELSRRKIPFVKYGGLKFLETAHIKDLFALLRLAENPRDEVSGLRVLMLLPGVGPKRAAGLMDQLLKYRGDFSGWRRARVPEAAAARRDELVDLMACLTRSPQPPLADQVRLARQFYAPLLEERFDNAEPRRRDLEQLELIVGRSADRRSLLVEMALDGPPSSEDFAGPPLLDEDYLILSTIHSAKGLEWKAVFVLHAADGNIPSDMATGSPQQIEEERRLFYVALTRARDWLYVCCPRRYYHAHRGPKVDRYGVAQISRFVTDAVGRCFDRRVVASAAAGETGALPSDPPVPSQIRERIKALLT